MNIREVFKQAAQQVMQKLSNIALAVKLVLGASPEAARPAMAMAANAGPSFGLGASSNGAGARRPQAMRRPHRDDE